MTGICISPYPSPYPIEKIGDSPYTYLEMTNKPVPVGIVWTRLRFDGESPHWLGMDMGMENPRFFQLGMGMGMGMNISPL